MSEITTVTKPQAAIPPYTSKNVTYYGYDVHVLNKKVNYNDIEIPPNDYKLLCSLYEVNSPSGDEEQIRQVIISFLKKIKGVSYEIDGKGNILVTKGELESDEYYPCIAAHMDTVHHNKGDIKIATVDDDKISNGTIIWCQNFDIITNKYAECGGAGDDKNGVYIAIKAIRKLKKIKAAFFVSEEVGCVGSGFVDLNFFKDCSFIIQSDRKNGTNLITKFSGQSVCSDVFLKYAKDFGEEYGFSEDIGTVTDVMTLQSRGVGISVMNISSGYYKPHTKQEYTILNELFNSYEYCLKLLTDIPNNVRYTHEYKAYVYPTYKNAYNDNYYDNWDTRENYLNTYAKPKKVESTTYQETQFNKEKETYTKKPLGKIETCICNEINFHIDTTEIECPVCNPVIKKSVYKCEICGDLFDERKLTYSCTKCNNHKIKNIEI